MADAVVSVYELPVAGRGIRQGEILAGVVQYRLDLATLDSPQPAIDFVTHPYAIVMTQDCDLDWDFKARQAVGDRDRASKQLPNILFCEVTTAESLRATAALGSKMWQRIRQNNDDRYQFLERVDPAQDMAVVGLPELAIDFKRYFTLPADEMYERIKADTRRRTRLVTPYAEHLSSRFANFLSRIALPRDHESEPSA